MGMLVCVVAVIAKGEKGEDVLWNVTVMLKGGFCAQSNWRAWMGW